MTREEVEGIYHGVWGIYCSWEHIETLLRRATAAHMHVPRLVSLVFEFYGSYKFERLHPLQSGLFRRKSRTARRPEFPRESVFVYYPKRLWEMIRTYVPATFWLGKLLLLWWKVRRDPERYNYLDLATTPVEDQLEEELEMFEVTEAARNTVAKARKKQQSLEQARERSL